jgi:hypothetical protein
MMAAFCRSVLEFINQWLAIYMKRVLILRLARICCSRCPGLFLGMCCSSPAIAQSTLLWKRKYSSSQRTSHFPKVWDRTAGPHFTSPSCQ